MTSVGLGADLERALSQRGAAVADRIAKTARTLCPNPVRALDLGGGDGSVTGILTTQLGVRFILLDRTPTGEDGGTFSPIRGTATSLPFRDGTFDLVTLISVYEHLGDRTRRESMLREILRVLRPGGVLVGQMPNMNFPVEIHSKLPLVQFLPRSMALPYYRLLAPVSRERKRQYGIRWYRVTASDLWREAHGVGFQEGRIWAVNLPRQALPAVFQPFYVVTRAIPLNWDFYFVRPARGPVARDKP